MKKIKYFVAIFIFKAGARVSIFVNYYKKKIIFKIFKIFFI